MTRVLLRLVIVVALVSVATFLATSLTPGDPVAAIVGRDATRERYEEVHDALV